MSRAADRAWFSRAVAGGIIAGIAFIAFEMIAGVVSGGVEGAGMPLRMIAGIALGPQALAPAYPAATALEVGVVMHFILSIVFAVIFAAGNTAGVDLGIIACLASSRGSLWPDFVGRELLCDRTGGRMAMVPLAIEPSRPVCCARIVLWRGDGRVSGASNPVARWGARLTGASSRPR